MHVVRTDGTVDRWTSERDGTIVRTADRDSKNFWLENRAESSDITLNSRIPDKSIFTNK
jgi:outer membrane lipoprotein-sorting protein